MEKIPLKTPSRALLKGFHPLTGILRKLCELVQDWIFNQPRPTPTVTIIPSRLRFKEAVDYAKKVYNDEALQSAYRKLAPAAHLFRLAISDALCGPHISDLFHLVRKGEDSLTIRIKATDNVAVAKVLFRFVGADGHLLEEGMGHGFGDRGWWIYTTRHSIDDLPDSLVTITAFDISGNKAIICKYF